MDGRQRSTERSTAMDSGQKRLEEMGYKQELRRDLTLVTSLFIGITALSPMTGITPLYNIGLTYGGPVSFVYGWLFVGFLNCLVASSMAEICSAFPTAGGLYYWSYALAGPKWGPLASWLTGWFNLIGQVVANCSVNFSLALLLQTIILLSTGGGNGGGYFASKYVVVAMHGGSILTEALINCFAVSWLGYIGIFGAVVSFFGVLTLAFTIPLVAVHRASASSVFTSFNTENGLGIQSYPYIVVVSLLLVQYSIMGYDGPAHFSEETERSDRGSAYSIVGGVVYTVVTGWLFLVGITFAAVDPAHLLDSENDAKGYAMAQMFFDAFRDRYGSGTGGIICLCIPAVSLYTCGVTVVSINSRLLYSFSRDGAVPLWRVWRLLNRNNVPVAAVWLSCLIAFLLALTYLGSAVAFEATVSIPTISMFTAYGLPILFCITIGHKNFVPGPVNLGRFSRLVGTLSVLWIMTCSVIFCLPVAYPITSETLNYAPIMLLGALLLVLGGWFFNARFWFNGPYSKERAKGDRVQLAIR